MYGFASFGGPWITATFAPGGSAGKSAHLSSSAATMTISAGACANDAGETAEAIANNAATDASWNVRMMSSLGVLKKVVRV
jgi:hypothetical protein